MLHEVAIMMMLITRGESEPDTGSVLELDDDVQGCCWLVVCIGSSQGVKSRPVQPAVKPEPISIHSASTRPHSDQQAGGAFNERIRKTAQDYYAQTELAEDFRQKHMSK